jgi:hypothetical protein
MAQIEIQGIDALFRKLGNVTAISTLRPPMQRSVYRLQAGMAKYPAQRAGSSYRRTGTLGRRWTSVVTESVNGLVGTVGNNTSYGPWVQSEMFQAAVHRGRWQTDQDVATKETPAIIADFEQAIGAALR